VKRVPAGRHPTAQVAQDLESMPNLLRRWKHEIAGYPVTTFTGKGRLKAPRRGPRQTQDGFGPCHEEERGARSVAHTSPSRRHELPGRSFAYEPYPSVAIDGWSPRFGISRGVAEDSTNVTGATRPCRTRAIRWAHIVSLD
jgi:hypothetical protein